MGVTFWQAAGAVVTALGVLTALGIALWGEHARRREREAEQLAEARMFRVRGTGSRDRTPTDEVPSTREFVFHVEHHGPTPVFDIYYEAWAAGSDVTGRATMAAHRSVAEPRQELDCAIPIASQPFALAAWRVRWCDRFGNEWMVHEGNRAGVGSDSYEPERYRPGLPAPRY